MKIPQPFIPLRAETNGLEHTVHVIGRDYTIGADGMITSIKSEGVELLAAPMRVVSVEDGEPSDWDMNYPENESESFIQRRSDEEIVICGAKQSDRFIIDTCYKIDYDGCIDIDFKLMTRGKTVAQVFGIAETKPTLFKLDKLWLEIPLRADAMTLFTSYPNSAMWLADGTERPYTDMSMSGKIPEQTAAMPFKALLWLGNEERGLGWFAESDRNWQPVSNTDAMELVRDGDTLILRGDGRYEVTYVPAGNELYKTVPIICGQFFAPASYYASVYVPAAHRQEKSAYCALYDESGVLEDVPYTLLINTVPITSEESARIQQLYTSLKSAVNAYLVEFVTRGVTDERFADFLTELNSIGAQEYVSLYQTAYDRYMKGLSEQ